MVVEDLEDGGEVFTGGVGPHQLDEGGELLEEGGLLSLLLLGVAVVAC